MTRLILLAVLSLSCMASAEVLHIRCRYTETRWTVATLTGLTYDEKEVDKILPRPLEVVKAISKDRTGVKLTASSRGGIDTSDDDVVTLTADDAKKVVDALSKFQSLARAAQTKRENSNTELVNVDDDVIVMFVSANSGRKVFIELALGDACFVLGKNEADKLAAAIRKSL